MLKVVLDTNQFLSGFIVKEGLSAQVFQAWRDFSYILITSDEILAEVARVFQYPRIVRKYQLQKESVDSFISLIEREAVVLYDVPKVKVVKNDPADDKILACALEAKAEYIISGDSHLLDLSEYKAIKIITAREFLKILDKHAYHEKEKR